MESVLIKLLAISKSIKIPVLIILSLITLALIGVADTEFSLLLVASIFIILSVYPKIINVDSENHGKYIFLIIGIAILIFSLLMIYMGYKTENNINKEDTTINERFRVKNDTPPKIHDCISKIDNQGIKTSSGNNESYLNFDESSIGLLTAGEKSTYYRTGLDLSRFIEKYTNIDVIPLQSSGTVENFYKVTSKIKKYNMGFMQEDFYLWAERNPLEIDRPERLRKVNYVTSLFKEHIHIFVKSNSKIFDLTDLSGKTVYVSSKESGSYFTASNINELLTKNGNDPFEIKYESTASSICRIVKGYAIDAVIYVGGAPVPIISKISSLGKEDTNNLRLLNIDLNSLDGLKDYSYTEEHLSKNEDYSWLNGPVSTISTKAILFSHNFSKEKNTYTKKRCNQVIDIKNLLSNKKSDMKKFVWSHKVWKNSTNMTVNSGIEEINESSCY